MATKVVIEISELRLEAELGESTAAKELVSRLPVEVKMSRWGDEYYGGVGSSLPTAGEMRDVMEVGEIAYWPPGRALCFFFGPTPASEGEEPRAASPVVPLGRVLGDATLLKKLGGSITAHLRVG